LFYALSYRCWLKLLMHIHFTLSRNIYLSPLLGVGWFICLVMLRSVEVGWSPVTYEISMNTQSRLAIFVIVEKNHVVINNRRPGGMVRWPMLIPSVSDKDCTIV
jgi:hypothetical protein